MKKYYTRLSKSTLTSKLTIAALSLLIIAIVFTLNSAVNRQETRSHAQIAPPLTVSSNIYTPNNCSTDSSGNNFVCSATLSNTSGQQTSWTASPIGTGTQIQPSQGTLSAQGQTTVSYTIPRAICQGANSHAEFLFKISGQQLASAVSNFWCSCPPGVLCPVPTVTPTPMHCGGNINSPAPSCAPGYTCQAPNHLPPGDVGGICVPNTTLTCIPRPSCLDAVPRCLIAEPADGWCPVVSPTPPNSCQDCAAGFSFCTDTTTGQHSCRNTALGTPQPSTLSCQVCPQPKCVPMPPQCKPGSPLGIPCPKPPLGGWCPTACIPRPVICQDPTKACPIMLKAGETWCPAPTCVPRPTICQNPNKPCPLLVPIGGWCPTTTGITVATDLKNYKPTDKITATAINSLSIPIYALDTKAGCSILGLQALTADQWQNSSVDRCPLGRPASVVKIYPGQKMPITIKSGSSPSFPVGIYRLVLTYATTQAQLLSNNTSAIYSSAFYVENGSCIPRPPCLDAVPRCTIPQPNSGWCPITTPLPTSIFVTPTIFCLGSCPTLPPTATPIPSVLPSTTVIPSISITSGPSTQPSTTVPSPSSQPNPCGETAVSVTAVTHKPHKKRKAGQKRTPTDIGLLRRLLLLIEQLFKLLGKGITNPPTTVPTPTPAPSSTPQPCPSTVPSLSPQPSISQPVQPSTVTPSVSVAPSSVPTTSVIPSSAVTMTPVLSQVPSTNPTISNGVSASPIPPNSVTPQTPTPTSTPPNKGIDAIINLIRNFIKQLEDLLNTLLGGGNTGNPGPGVSPTPVISSVPSNTPSALPTSFLSPVLSATPFLSNTPIPTATPAPTDTPTPPPSNTPVPTATDTPIPTSVLSPSIQLSQVPSTTVSQTPTAQPTQTPTNNRGIRRLLLPLLNLINQLLLLISQLLGRR